MLSISPQKKKKKGKEKKKRSGGEGRVSRALKTGKKNTKRGDSPTLLSYENVNDPAGISLLTYQTTYTFRAAGIQSPVQLYSHQLLFLSTPKKY